MKQRADSICGQDGCKTAQGLRCSEHIWRGYAGKSVKRCTIFAALIITRQADVSIQQLPIVGSYGYINE
jgi:hypothetical protein